MVRAEMIIKSTENTICPDLKYRVSLGFGPCVMDATFSEILYRNLQINQSNCE